MHLNENTAIATSKLTLVPYEPHHVPLYHEWMQDEELQAATASEPLSLTQEYEMQKSWREDNNKLTFIICEPLPVKDGVLEANPERICAGQFDSSEKMIGDVNLFLCKEDDEENVTSDHQTRQTILVGEIEIMIARKNRRGKGFGKAALEAFLEYVTAYEEAICAQYLPDAISDGRAMAEKHCLAFSYLRVKINADNSQSIALFEGFQFKKISEEANYFGELELRRVLAHHAVNANRHEDQGGRSCIFLGYNRRG